MLIHSHDLYIIAKFNKSKLIVQSPLICY